MTTKKNNPNKGKGVSGTTPGVKKPYATIDVKATEVVRDGKQPEPIRTGAARSGPADKSASGAPMTPDQTGQDKGATRTLKSPAPKTPPGAGSGARDSKSGAQKSSAPKKSRSGIGSMLSHMAAGIVGGFLALVSGDAIAPHLSKLGLSVPSAGVELKTATAVLEKRLAALETTGSGEPSQELEALSNQMAVAQAKIEELGSVSRYIQELEKQQERIAAIAIETEAKVAQNKDQGVALERFEALEKQLATLEAAAGQGLDGKSGIANLSVITGRLVDLETSLNSQMSALRSSVGEDIETRISRISEASEAAKSGTVRMDRQLSTVTTEAARLSQRIEVLKADNARLTETLRVVQEESGAAKSELQGFKGDMSRTIGGLAKPSQIAAAVAPLAADIRTLKASIADVVSAEKDRKNNARRIVLSLELGNLKRALERGDGYAAELAEVRKASNGVLDLAKLQEFEATGVPTLRELEKSFRPVSHAVVDSARVPSEGSMIDQLLAGARSVVRVRKTDFDTKDTSVEAIVARMEKAVKAGQLDQVIAAADMLDPGVREPASAWIDKVQSRRSVDVALRVIENQLKASLGGSDPTSPDTSMPTQAN